jgi:hypothetical protein
LRALLFRVDCPSPDRWRDFYFKFLADDETAHLSAHLDGCPYCTREMLILRAFVPEPVPAPVPTESTTLWDQMQWWVAQLIQGPRMLPAAGIRGRASGDQQWMYNAGGMRLGVDSHRDPAQPDRCVLVGAVLGEDAVGWTVHLWRGAELIATTVVDDLGGFNFAGLTCGDYELTLTGPDMRVYLPGLSLQ